MTEILMLYSTIHDFFILRIVNEFYFPNFVITTIMHQSGIRIFTLS